MRAGGTRTIGAPADLPKESGRFDLPIAVGILAAAGQIDSQRLAACEMAGELSLAGELRPVRGALALALALQREGTQRSLILPAASAQAAAQVPGLDVRGARCLAEVVAALMPGDAVQGLAAAQPLPRAPAPTGPDLRDVKGQAGQGRAGQGFLVGQGRQQPRQALRQHRLARARRADEQQAVSARRSDFQRGLGRPGPYP